MKVIFSEEATRDLQQIGASDDVFLQLADAIAEHPRTVYTIDTFDGISCFGVPLSWLRDHSTGEAIVMARREAYKLDRISGKDPTYPAMKMLF